MANFGRLVLLAVVWVAPFGAHAQWAHQPSSFGKVYECNFSDTLCGGWSANITSSEPPYASPGGANQLSGPRVLDAALTGTSSNANGNWGYDVGTLTQEIYVGFSWRSTAWGYNHGNNKLIFIREPSNSLLVWQGPAGTAAKTLKWYQQEYIDNCHISFVCPSKTGDGTGWYEPNVNAQACTFAPDDGTFHKIEIYLKASTGLDTRDGVVRIWCDDVLSTDYTNVNQGHGAKLTQVGTGWSLTGGTFPGGFRDFQINNTWDGQPAAQCQSSSNPSGRDCTHDWHHYFDHVVVALGEGGVGTGGGSGAGGGAGMGGGTLTEPHKPSAPVEGPQNNRERGGRVVGGCSVGRGHASFVIACLFSLTLLFHRRRTKRAA